MELVTETFLGQLKKPSAESHKGQNGRVLVIAGSDKYHGALLLAIQAVSRIVDMVYVYSPDNVKLVEKLKSEVAVFINVLPGELWNTADFVDAILIGPGLAENRSNKKILEKILSAKGGPASSWKNIVIDAAALWHVDPHLLHSNCVVTPHSREFENVFACDSKPENVEKMAKYYGCIIVLKGKYDYISDGKDLFENRTGNVGMTKGGTGDVISGLITGLAAKNDTLTSALAGIYLTGLAGDRLYEKYGTFYNAEDVIQSLGEVWKVAL